MANETEKQHLNMAVASAYITYDYAVKGLATPRLTGEQRNRFAQIKGEATCLISYLCYDNTGASHEDVVRAGEAALKATNRILTK